MYNFFRQIAPYGQWIHLAVVYDGATITLYVDKMPVMTVALTGKYQRRFGLTHCHTPTKALTSCRLS